jgi:hypothetical protein
VTAVALSSRKLGALPSPEVLRTRCRVLALLDRLLCPEPDLRTLTFIPDPASGTETAEWDAGDGDFWAAWFAPEGALVYGLDHTCTMSPWRRKPPSLWPGLLEGLPGELAVHPAAPPLERDALTFCFWHTPKTTGWRHGRVAFPRQAAWTGTTPDPDGSLRLLRLLDGVPETFALHARAIYGRAMDVDAIRLLFQGATIDDDLAHRLDRRRDPELTVSAARELGLATA